MPPLAVVGYGIATRNVLAAGGAFALFVTNFVTIALSATVMARFYGFGHHLSRRQGWMQTIVLLLVFVAMAVPLGISLNTIGREAVAVSQARTLLARKFGEEARVTQLDLDFATTLAAVVSTGAAMLADWPVSFERFVHARADALRNDREAFLHWRTLLRRISVAKTEGQDQSALIIEVLPDLKASFERSFAGVGRYYLPNETVRCWGVDHDDVLAAVDAGAVRATRLPGITRRRMQLDAVEVEAVGRLLRATPAINSLPGSLGLPLYGIEQLIDARLLRWERHPAVLAVRDWVCVQRRSLDLLLERLARVVRTGVAPKDTVSLCAASRRIGGREKPWAAIIAAILTGRLLVWGDGDRFNTGKMFVRPGDMARFDAITFEAARSDFPFSTVISQIDLGELLNVAPKYLAALTEDFELMFAEVGRAECTDKAGALEVAARMASSAEIGHHMGIHSRKADTATRKRSMTRVSVGWDRRQLMDLGILPGA